MCVCVLSKIKINLISCFLVFYAIFRKQVVMDGGRVFVQNKKNLISCFVSVNKPI